MENKLERIKSAQIGMFIKIIESDIPIEEFSDLNSLAKHISAEFSVICDESDLKDYFALGNIIVEENYEVESKMIEYGI